MLRLAAFAALLAIAAALPAAPAPYHAPAPAAYGAHFPSHFYPEKLYQYWHHYYPRIPGTGHKYFL